MCNYEKYMEIKCQIKTKNIGTFSIMHVLYRLVNELAFDALLTNYVVIYYIKAMNHLTIQSKLYTNKIVDKNKFWNEFGSINKVHHLVTQLQIHKRKITDATLK